MSYWIKENGIEYTEIGTNFFLSHITHLKPKIEKLFKDNRMKITNIPRKYVDGELSHYETIVAIPKLNVSAVFTQFKENRLLHHPKYPTKVAEIRKKKYWLDSEVNVPEVELEELSMPALTLVKENLCSHTKIIDLERAISAYEKLFETYGCDLNHLATVIVYETNQPIFIISNSKKVYLPIFYNPKPLHFCETKKYLIPPTPKYKSKWIHVANLKTF